MSNRSAFAFESITLTDKPQGLSTIKFRAPEGHAEVAHLTVEGEGRYRYDGGEPDSVTGHQLRDGATITLTGELQMENFKAVTTGNEPCVISISYERA
jgi:hypothetical protein